MDDKDRNKFLTLIAESLETYQVVLHAYIMMANHFHLLIETRKANCSEFMRHFNICYTGWFNWRHGRNGNLYQGRYKAFLIDVDNYLLEVSRYLHLNIVRGSRVRSWNYRECWQYAKVYRWSSLAGYVSVLRTVRYVDYDLILSMVGGRRAYCDFVIEGLKRGVENPYEKMRHQMILGDGDFEVEVKRFLRCGSIREQPTYRDLVAATVAPEMLLDLLMKEFGWSKEIIMRRGAKGVIRGIAAELLYRYSGVTQAQIGSLLGGIDYMAVYQLRRRLKEWMKKDTAVKKQYNEAEARLQTILL